MSCWLKQSTAADVMLGPFLDSADGNTVESGLTITQPDIRLSKNGGAFAQKSAAQTLVHGENGWYPANLSTTDTNTLGVLIVAVHESGALPVWREFLVVPANVYDSFFSTDLLQVDLTQWLGVAPLALTSQFVQAQSVLFASAVTNSTLGADSGLKPILTGTAAGGAAGSITLDGSASSVNDFYKGARIYLTLGTGAGQSRICTAYNGTSKVATIEPNWITNPSAATTSYVLRDDASTLAIATGGIASGSFAAGAVNAASIASDTITAAKIAADAITAAKIAAGAIDDDAVAADMDSYSGKIWIIKQSTTKDEYGVTFYKNGQPIETGITVPLIDYVKKLSDGSILINDASLTDQSNGDYYYGETTNKLVAGNAYMARVTATIDGATRFFKQQIGRDSV